MKNSLSSYVRNTAFRPAGLSRGSSSSEAFWNAPFSLANSSIFSPVNCWNTRGFVLASSYFIFFPPLPSFYSLLHAFPIDSTFQKFVIMAATRPCVPGLVAAPPLPRGDGEILPERRSRCQQHPIKDQAQENIRSHSRS